MATTEQPTWTIDPVHSSAEFSLAYMGFTTYRTGFRSLDGTLRADLLGGNDHPTISFRSTRVEPTDTACWKVTGDLTIHGVTKPVVLGTHFLGQGVHPFSKKVSAAFRAETVVDRSQFGVTWNAALDTGGPYLGERVNISIVILAARQD